LSATIQALEVQRMTLSTLQSMNVVRADVAAAMSGKTAAASDKKSDAPGQSPIDPMQWWNVIGQQFQTIASQAVADMQTHSQAFTAAAKPAKTERTASPAAPGKSTTRQTAARKSSTAKPRKTSRQ